jgi:hypothetical protein
MFALTRLLNALTGLADNLAALSATVGELNAGLRHRLALDGAGTPEAPALMHETAPDGTAGAAAAEGRPPVGRGRRKAKGAG